MGWRDEVAGAVSRVAEEVGPSVVRVGRGRGRGGGLVVGEGRVLTNAHNLRGSEVTITFADGRSEVGTVAGIDPDGDLAVVSVGTAELRAPGWAEGDGPVLGAPVLTVSTPPGGGVRVTLGTVSSTGRSFRGPGGRAISGGVEHTAPLARGSSGTPLVDLDGKVAGLSTHRIGDGFYLALPADPALRERVDALARGESRRRVRLGVALAPPHAALRLRAAVGLDERDGLLVRAVEEGSLAAAAGIGPGDLLVAAGGAPVTRLDDLLAALDAVAAGGTLEVTVVRGTGERTVSVAVAPPEGGSTAGPGGEPGASDRPGAS
ncbi:MAG: S1C family serine protease [Acidimicrobiales bacterium]